MSVKTKVLVNILEKNNLRHLSGSLPGLSSNTLRKSGFHEHVFEIFQELGGRGEMPLNCQIDAELEKSAVVLDEENAFNRYRLITLNSKIYGENKFFNTESYKRYCRQFESECLKSASAADKWSNTYAESCFGKSSGNGDLSGEGSAAWKMKAFTDFITDLSSIINRFHLVRLSVYDNLLINKQLVKLNQILLSKSEVNEPYIWKYLSRRLGIQVKTEDDNGKKTEELN
jgi:hypothetical protein